MGSGEQHVVVARSLFGAIAATAWLAACQSESDTVGSAAPKGVLGGLDATDVARTGPRSGAPPPPVASADAGTEHVDSTASSDSGHVRPSDDGRVVSPSDASTRPSSDASTHPVHEASTNPLDGSWHSDAGASGPVCAPVYADAGAGLGACALGVPCASGCCPSNAVTDRLNAGGTNDGRLDVSSIAVDSLGRAHVVFADSSGQGLVYEAPDGAGWTRTLLDPTPFAADSGALIFARSPALAIAHAGRQDVVYAAYAPTVRDEMPTRGRFGTKGVAGWTFEDLPGAPLRLRIDPQGNPVLLTSDDVLIRRYAGGWETITPGTAPSWITDFAIDQAGDFFGLAIAVVNLHDIELSLLHKPVVGDWIKEPIASGFWINSAKIEVGGGTVHVGYLTDFGIEYARKESSGWTRLHVTADLISQFSMAVDPCGAPQFVGFIRPSGGSRYYRWTTEGWKYTVLEVPACSGGYGVDLQLSADTAYASYFDCSFHLASIPLR